MKLPAVILISAGLILTPFYLREICETCKTSTTGKTALRSVEGFMPSCYKDAGDKYTIGFGHLMLPEEKCRDLEPLSPPEAEDLLERDLRPKEAAINRLLPGIRLQHQFDAESIFVFNLGESNFERSTLLKKIRSNTPIEEIKPYWLAWNRVNGKVNKGIVRRRELEFEIFSAK